jgi:hypothetical protein
MKNELGWMNKEQLFWMAVLLPRSFRIVARVVAVFAVLSVLGMLLMPALAE